MAITRSNKAVILLCTGAIISAALSCFAIYLIAFSAADISMALAALIIGACALPAVILGLPYFNAHFDITYTRDSGLNIREEKRQIKKK
jgi:hypothetical protein